MKDIFNDKASLLLRLLLRNPEKKRAVRDFVDELGVGRGWAGHILSQLRTEGYIEGKDRGKNAYSILRERNKLIKEWTTSYSYDLNTMHVFYSANPNLLLEIKKFFKKSQHTYALTLHSGANLITNFVRDDNVYIYLQSEPFQEISLELRQHLDLKELKKGGNVYLIKPYYKNSAFWGMQKIKGYSVVSNLQLYLDLYHFPNRGQEHANYLKRILKEEGKSLD